MRFALGSKLLLVLALLLPAPAGQAQSYPVSFGMQTVLETFFAPGGMVAFRAYDAAFVPPGGLTAEVVLADADGTILARFPFQAGYAAQSQVFARLEVVGPAEVQLTEPGVYNIFLLANGEIATRMPFVVRAAGDASDPFAAAKTYVVDGLWRQLGYLTSATSSAGPAPRFHFWTGGLDLPEGATTDGFVATLQRGDQVVAHSKRRRGHIPEGHFKRTELELFHPHSERESPNAAIFTMADLAGLDGELVLRVTRNSDDALLRAFRLTVRDGKVQPHERAVLGYQPQMDFLLPRVVKSGSNVYEMVEALWFESR